VSVDGKFCVFYSKTCRILDGISYKLRDYKFTYTNYSAPAAPLFYPA
jgi:hypothetical protein